MDPVSSFAALEEQISLLREATDAVLLDTIGLGQKMQEAFGQDAVTSLSSQMLWTTLQSEH